MQKHNAGLEGRQGIGTAKSISARSSKLTGPRRAGMPNRQTTTDTDSYQCGAFCCPRTGKAPPPGKPEAREVKVGELKPAEILWTKKVAWREHQAHTSDHAEPAGPRNVSALLKNHRLPSQKAAFTSNHDCEVALQSDSAMLSSVGHHGRSSIDNGSPTVESVGLATAVVPSNMPSTTVWGNAEELSLERHGLMAGLGGKTPQTSVAECYDMDTETVLMLPDGNGEDAVKICAEPATLHLQFGQLQIAALTNFGNYVQGFEPSSG